MGDRGARSKCHERVFSPRVVVLTLLSGPHEGFEAIKTVIGPMGRYASTPPCADVALTWLGSSVDDLELAARVMLGAVDPLDDVMPLPFREIKLGPKLRFGYYTEGMLNTESISPSYASPGRCFVMQMALFGRRLRTSVRCSRPSTRFEGRATNASNSNYLFVSRAPARWRVNAEAWR